MFILDQTQGSTSRIVGTEPSKYILQISGS